MNCPAERPAAVSDSWLEVSASIDFPTWLEASCCSLAVTSSPLGKLFLVGLQPNGRLGVQERTFPGAMGLCYSSGSIWLASQFQLWRLEQVLEPGQTFREHDQLWVPRVGNTTGNLLIHDLDVDQQGRILFANTQFNCVATLDARHSFSPVWRPPFISQLVPEDRCHLNGLALVDGRLGFVTILGASDAIDGWRDHRTDGGLVMDTTTNQNVGRGLSMPHSPRWHNDRLWLHQSGTGEFGHLELASGRFEPIAFCPGYLRGLTFCGGMAIASVSQARHERTFQGLPLQERLASRGIEPRCGLYVIDLKRGHIAHWLRFEGLVTELSDVAVIPGARCPLALGFKSDEIQHTFTLGQDAAR